MVMVTDTAPPIDGWAAAEALQQRLAEGGTLLDLDSPVPLAPGETLHAGIEAHCSWYGPADVTYTQQRLLIFGSTPWLAASAATSAIGNHRRRRSTAALAAPQWRSLGVTHVLLTSQRLLVRNGDEFLRLPHPEIQEVIEFPDPRQLDIGYSDGTTLSLYGTWTRYVAIALSAV